MRRDRVWEISRRIRGGEGGEVRDREAGEGWISGRDRGEERGGEVYGGGGEVYKGLVV